MMALVAVPGVVLPVSAVCAPPPPLDPDFFMDPEPGFLTMAKGDTKTSEITLTSIDGFADAVSLTVSWDTGLTAILEKEIVENMPDSVTLTVSTDPNIDFGFYDVTVLGSSDSPPRENSAVVTVHVPDFSVDASPTSLTLNLGQFKESTITVTSELHFTGEVILSTIVFPEEGPTATLTRDSVTLQPGGSDTVTLTVTSTVLTPPGEYTVEIAGTFESTPEPIVQSALVDVLVGGDFRMSASPSSLTIEEEMSADSTITLTSLYEFSGTVDLAVDQDLPAGFTAELDQLSVSLAPGGTATATLTVNVGDLAQTPAIEFIAVMGVSGEKHDSTGVRVSVPGPTIELSASPDSLRIDPGSADSSIITVTSIRGFNEPIDLTATSFDPCLTVTLTDDPVTPPAGGSITSTLNIAVDAVTPLDIYFVIVSGVYLNNFLVSDVTVITVIVGDIDTTPPTWPPESSLTASQIGQTSMTLSWTDAEDDVGIESYEILQDGETVDFVSGTTTSYVVIGLLPSTPYEFQVVAYDAAGNSADGPSVPVTTAGPTNQTPVADFTFTPINPNVGQAVSFDGSGSSDSDGTIASYSWAFGDSGTETGAIVSHTYDSADTFTVTLTVTDNEGATDTETRTITINEPSVNNPPSLTVPDSPVPGNELSEISFTISASDLDTGQTVTLVCNECGSRGAVFTATPGNPASGTFRWTPTEAQGADNDYVFTFVATDSGSPVGSDTTTLTVHVNEVNVPPVLISIGSKTAQETTTLSFTATASDNDLPTQTLTFSVGLADSGNFPTGATVTSSGTFAWTPTAAQGPGTYRARITVTDGLLEDFEEITVTVTEPAANNPPVLATIGNQQVNEGETLTFSVTATDSDGGQTVTLSASGLPSGATFNPSTGQFSWTPTEAQGPGTFTVTFTATDNGTPSRSTTQTITITVAAPQQAPTAPRPFWEEYWYVLLIVVLVLAGIPVAVKLRGKPGSKSQV